MLRFIVIEIGDSAYTEFKSKSGAFQPTDDAVVIGIVDAHSKEEAIDRACALPQNKDRSFDNLIAHELR